MPQRSAGAGRQRSASLAATDRLTLATLGVLAIVALGGHEHGARGLFTCMVLGLGVALLAALAERSRWAEVAHDCSPILWIPAVFSASGALIAAANPARWDARFASLDDRWFHTVWSAWFGLGGRPAWLVDFASVSYFSFYLVPIAVALRLRREAPTAFARFAFIVEATFFATILGYALFPTTGPRVADAQAAAAIGGGPLAAALRAFLSLAERNLLDAFPSGHAAVSIVVAVCGGRYLPRWRAWLAFFATMVVFSTVYLSLHYIVDLVAGATLAAAVLANQSRLERAFGVGPPRRPVGRALAGGIRVERRGRTPSVTGAEPGGRP